MMRICPISVLAAAGGFIGNVLGATYNTTTYQGYAPGFLDLIRELPSVTTIATSDIQLFHEGSVYHPSTKSLWVCSDQIAVGNATDRYISRIAGLHSPTTVRVKRVNTRIPNPVGGFRYIQGTQLGDVILFVAQGSLAKTPPGGIYAVNPYPPYNSSLLLGSYGDYPFNSLDDITVTPDGLILVSDP